MSEWLAAVDAIQPASVEVYTLDRPAASGSLRRASTRRLREIAERVKAMGIAATVYAR